MTKGETEDREKKKARKAALKAEAEKMGISYEELKANKKDAKNQKRTREADKLEDLDHKEEMKRMRSWSHDFVEGTQNEKNRNDEVEPMAKKRRTRSMDMKEERADTGVKSVCTLSPEKWRNEHSITIQGHGKYRDLRSFPDPFLKFTDTPFTDIILKTFQKSGFESPLPIQSQAWPIALKGMDMICIAKTGSGKTCGFLLPSLHQHTQNRTVSSKAPKKPTLLVLAPTRELACQIMDETRKFGWPLGLNAICCYGGSSKYGQISMLQRGVDCIIATPGRMNDLLEMKKADLSNVKFLVLDEADRMLDMGFEPQIRSVVKYVPESRQTLLFSATWPKEIQKLAHDFLKDPIQINVGEVDALVANKDITQSIIMCTEEEKIDKLSEILKRIRTNDDPSGKPNRQAESEDMTKHPKVIVFTAKKVSCNDLANELWNSGFAVDSLHGDREQWERTKVINAFKDGTLRILVATDVAARGLDVKDVGIVVNFDMPAGSNAVEDYVHRIGRTGRAGSKGEAYTFFTAKDKKCASALVDVLLKAEQEVPASLASMARPRFSVGGRGGRGYTRGGRIGGRGYMSSAGGGAGQSFSNQSGGRFSRGRGSYGRGFR